MYLINSEDLYKLFLQSFQYDFDALIYLLCFTKLTEDWQFKIVVPLNPDSIKTTLFPPS